MFDGEHGIALHAMKEIGPQLTVWGSLMIFLELRQEPGVYSLVTAGVALQNSCQFSDFRIPV